MIWCRLWSLVFFFVTFLQYWSLHGEAFMLGIWSRFRPCLWGFSSSGSRCSSLFVEISGWFQTSLLVGVFSSVIRPLCMLASFLIGFLRVLVGLLVCLQLQLRQVLVFSWWEMEDLERENSTGQEHQFFRSFQATQGPRQGKP